MWEEGAPTPSLYYSVEITNESPERPLSRSLSQKRRAIVSWLDKGMKMAKAEQEAKRLEEKANGNAKAKV